MKKEILVAIAFGLVAGGILVYFLFFSRPPVTELADSDPLFAGATVLPQQEDSITAVSPMTSRYRNDRYFFTLEYPKELQLKELDEGGASTVVFQKPGEAKGFQIFIVGYRHDEITEARIRKDLGGAPMNNPTDIILPGNIRAVHFESQSPTLGPTTEVWFIHENYLYEVTTYAELDSWLSGILETLRFE